MTQAEREKLDETAKIAKRHADQLSNEIESILNESQFDSDYYGELRGMMYRVAAYAQHQQEERLALFEIIRNATNG